jgi:hypothetical protein
MSPSPSTNQQVSLIKNKFKKIVIWGFKTHTTDSFRHIYQGYYDALSKLGVPVLWVDDSINNNDYISRGDLVIGANISNKYLVGKKRVYFCTHNYSPKQLEGMDENKTIKLQVYTNKAELDAVKLGPLRYYNQQTRTLYQPWGTNLLEEEFLAPKFNRYTPLVFWVGSIWDNALHQGNRQEIHLLRQALLKHGKLLINPKHISNGRGIAYIRRSRISPAIAGNWQVKNNYLPCRVFKNISYGQLPFTNISKFADQYGSLLPISHDIDQLVSSSISVNQKDHYSRVKQLQELTIDYTYLSSLYYIAKVI